MAKREPRSITIHHILFAAGCAGLLLTTVWAFYNDYFQREYVGHQQAYNQLEIEKLAAAKEEAVKEWRALDQESIKLEDELEKVSKDLRKYERVLRDDRAAIGRINDDLALVRRNLNFAGTDTGVYNWDWLAAKEADKNAALSKVQAHIASTRDMFNTVLEKERELAKHNARIAEYEDKVKDAKKALAAFDARRIEISRALLKAKGNPALNFVKDAPGLDFIDPRWNLNDQLVLPNLPVDVLFAHTQRVDRCVTCHKGIDNPDPALRKLDGDKKVLRSHPRLDLYVGANSKHPMKTFGCTVCHQGRGMGVSFLRAAHTPQNPEQGDEWRKQHGWNTLDQHAPGQPLWDNPMLPLQYTEASCAKCHKGTDRVPEATKLNHGRELFRERGCQNCHIGSTDPDMAWMGRIGPDLRQISEKSDTNWTRAWIENPWKFRPDTKMPRIFGLENRKDLVNGELQPERLQQVAYEGGKASQADAHHPREPVEIEAITTYLFAASKLRERKLPEPPKGDEAAGKQVFAQVGCLACHSTGAAKDKYNFNSHGPDLSRIGEKVTPNWLFDWLKNPKHYWAETRMPDLRLNDKEAADLTAYLLAEMKDPAAKPPKYDNAPVWAYDALITDLLKNNTPDFRIGEVLADSTALVRNELAKKVKYAVKPGESAKTDSMQGEWSEAQVDAVLKILDEMGKDQAEKDRVKKSFYAGAALIQHYGCYACHNIQGWTNAPLSCVNLHGEGNKDVAKFAFGHQSIPRTRWDWIYLKLARPRGFDEGALPVTKPMDRLRMPWFGLRKDSLPGQGGHGPEHGADHHAALKTPAADKAAAGGGAHAHGASSIGAAALNPDQDEGHGLTHQEIEALVTVVLSYTNEHIPMDMKKKPTPTDIALDRGERTIKALNCTGCHLVGLDRPLTEIDAVTGHFDPAKKGWVPLAAVLTKPAQSAAKNLGIYSDRDLVSLDHGNAKGFLNFGRGTYLTEVTLPILLAEYEVRRSPAEAPVKLGFQFLKENAFKKLKAGQDRWTTYGLLVSEEKFLELTRFLFDGKAEDAKKAYGTFKDQYVNVDVYEKIAGTAALKDATEESGFRLKEHLYREKVANGTAWPVVEIYTRWTNGEGRIVPHYIQTEGAQQQAPPSLAFEGGKVQPDWFYGFLKNVQPLRPTLNVRMPSFWTEGHSSAYKQVYPSGRSSVVNASLRPTGPNGEPAPGPENMAGVPDDAQQIIEYFNAAGHEKPYGFQPVPVLTGENQKRYTSGYHVLFPPDPKTNPNGVSCTSCHAIGNMAVPAPKGPNLFVVRRRFKDDWLRRFLTFPASIYPWANMPANFYDWTSYEYAPDKPLRNMAKGDEAEFNALTDRLNLAKFYMLNAGDGDIGKAPAPTATPAPAPAP